MKPLFVPIHVFSRWLAIPAAIVCVFLIAAAHGVAGPANDDLADAQVIPPGSSFTVDGTDVGATEEGFEEASSYPLAFLDGVDGSSSTVWYSWTPTVSGEFTAKLAYPGAIPVVGVFKAPTPGATSIIVASKTEDPYTPPVAVTAGQEYLFVVTTPSSYAATFTLFGSITPSSTPPVGTVPVVTALVKQSQAVRSTGQAGKIVFKLSAAAASDLTLAYKVGGTAAGGVDYKALKGTLTVPAGQTQAVLKVKPLPGTDDSPVKVTVTVQAGSGYTVGSPAKVKVKIIDG